MSSPTDRRPGIGAALRLAKASTRVIAQQARARYSCDLLTWPYREDFLAAWQPASCVPGWFTDANAAVLYAAIRDVQPATVVEIGSYLGKSTVFLAAAVRQLNPRGRVVAIDPHTGDRQQLEGLRTAQLPSYDLFRLHCQAAKVDDIIDARVTTSVQAADGFCDPVDLLYVDGWHSYEAVIADGKAWLPKLSAGGVVVFDDYRAYAEVREAVAELAHAGHFQLWGTVFGQAVGGVAEQPPRQIARALRGRLSSHHHIH